MDTLLDIWEALSADSIPRARAPYEDDFGPEEDDDADEEERVNATSCNCSESGEGYAISGSSKCLQTLDVPAVVSRSPVANPPPPSRSLEFFWLRTQQNQAKNEWSQIGHRSVHDDGSR
jgi:hypothetical protein